MIARGARDRTSGMARTSSRRGSVSRERLQIKLDPNRIETIETSREDPGDRVSPFPHSSHLAAFAQTGRRYRTHQQTSKNDKTVDASTTRPPSPLDAPGGPPRSSPNHSLAFFLVSPLAAVAFPSESLNCQLTSARRGQRCDLGGVARKSRSESGSGNSALATSRKTCELSSGLPLPFSRW